MKDAFGHGSNGYGGNSASDYLKRAQIGIVGSFSGRKLGTVQPKSAGAATVANLRAQLSTAQGPGHMAVLRQGIKNLVGGS